jgi:hypothetical protein
VVKKACAVRGVAFCTYTSDPHRATFRGLYPDETEQNAKASGPRSILHGMGWWATDFRPMHRPRTALYPWGGRGRGGGGDAKNHPPISISRNTSAALVTSSFLYVPQRSAMVGSGSAILLGGNIGGMEMGLQSWAELDGRNALTGQAASVRRRGDRVAEMEGARLQVPGKRRSLDTWENWSWIVCKCLCGWYC